MPTTMRQGATVAWSNEIPWRTVEPIRVNLSGNMGSVREWASALITDERPVENHEQFGPPEPEACADCGEPVSLGIVIHGERYCDESCANHDGWYLCERCRSWIREDEAVSTPGGIYCDDVCAARDGWNECDDCGEWCHEDDCITTSDCRHFCDPYCARSSGYYLCDRCDEYHPGTNEVNVGGGIEDWCDACTGRFTSRCYECGDRHYDGDLRYDEADGEYYCEHCGSSGLHDYGYTPRLEMFGDGPLFMGTELETDGGSRRGQYCRKLDSIDGFGKHFWMTRDGSLDNGVEITSHPMTLDYHVEIRDLYGAISDTAHEYGFTSHDNGRCGLHVHVNRDFFGKSEDMRDLGGYKVMRLMQRFETQLTIFSRRRDNHWCGYKTGTDYKPKEIGPSILRPEYEKEQGPLTKARAMRGETTHAQALNFEHYKTFEFRIFRGTLKWDTYFACLGLVEGLCHTVKKHGSIWVESVNWYDLIAEVVENCANKHARACLESYLDEKGLR